MSAFTNDFVAIDSRSSRLTPDMRREGSSGRGWLYMPDEERTFGYRYLAFSNRKL